MRLSLKEGNFIIFDGSIAGRMAIRDLLYMNRIEASFEEVSAYRAMPYTFSSAGYGINDLDPLSPFNSPIRSEVAQGFRINYSMPNGCYGTKILLTGEAILFTGDDLAIVKNYTLDREKSLLLINE